MTETPTASVVMTAYNGQAFIGRAIEGILSQTLTSLELIVIDDASADGTVAIVEGFHDARLRLIRNKQNRGISTSRNIGIDAARGPYIAGHDQDDVSLPERLEKTIAILEARPEAVLAANCSRFESSGKRFPTEPAAPPHVMAWRLFTRSNIYTSSVCLRAETLKTHALRYRQAYHYAEDFDLYHQLSEVGDIVHIPDVLTVIGDHGGNTSILKKAEMFASAKAFLLERYRDYVGEDVTPPDLDVVWDVAVLGLPATGTESLERLGSVLDRLAAEFLRRRQLAAPAEAEVLEDAARFWWRLVKRTAQHQGPSCLKLARTFKHLGAWRPSLGDRANAYLRAVGGPVISGLSSRRLWA